MRAKPKVARNSAGSRRKGRNESVSLLSREIQGKMRYFAEIRRRGSAKLYNKSSWLGRLFPTRLTGNGYKRNRENLGTTGTAIPKTGNGGGTLAAVVIAKRIFGYVCCSIDVRAKPRLDGNWLICPHWNPLRHTQIGRATRISELSSQIDRQSRTRQEPRKNPS